MLYPNVAKNHPPYTCQACLHSKITVTEQASPKLCLLWTSNVMIRGSVFSDICKYH